jgi:hypothetical protein
MALWAGAYGEANGLYARRLQAQDATIRDIPGCAGLTGDLDAMWAKLDALEKPAG